MTAIVLVSIIGGLAAVVGIVTIVALVAMSQSAYRG
jgi:hypothetical protein